MTPAPVVHWDDVTGRRVEVGPLAGVWRDLGRAAGSVTTGVRHVQVDAGRRSTPVHSHEGEEEIFFVLSGAGISWQDGQAFEVRAGDCLVHLPGGPAHTLVAGEQQLDVLAFGTRRPSALARLPRAGVAWDGATWVVTGPEPHPWAREAAAGDLPVPPPGPRPASIVNLEDVESSETRKGDADCRERDLGTAAGSVASGLGYVEVEPGTMSYPPHAHSAEEELFVVLAGSGFLMLYDCRRPGEPPREEPLRPGHVAAFPAGGGVAHGIRAGEGGITYLAYGERCGDDMCFYPRSQKLSFGAFGLMTRVPRLSYWDDEPPAGDAVPQA
jgi:uncharacterized cupin superfamily protein